MSKDKLSALHQAVLEGNLSEIRKRIEQGDDLNLQDRDGRTPLFQAVINGDTTIVLELLKGGANVNARDKNLETALHFAAREYKPEVAELLLKNGAEVDAQEVHGNTPLFRAVFDSKGRGEMIRLLISHSADKTLKNRHDMSPQDLANSIGNYNVRKFLE